LKPFDTSGTFSPPPQAVRRLAVQGAGAAMFSNGLGLVVQTLSSIILARLLTPADFGLVTMVTTFSLLLVNFGGNGFTEAVIQWKEINDRLASNLFWINLSVGVLLTIGFAAGGSLLARFYREPLVVHVATGISLTIFLTSTSVLHVALLKRAMHFSLTAANEIVARTVSLILSVWLAWRGWGYWALIGGAILQPLVTSIGAWSLCRWIPGLPRRVKGTGALVRFAMHVYGRFCFDYFARNTDNLLVGWRFEAQALGFYKKAYDLFALSAGTLVTPLSNVAVSAFSRLNRDPLQYKRQLLNVLAVVALVGMGLGADLTLVGKDLIRVMLGPGWEPSGRIFTFFGPGIGIMLLYSMHGWIHLSIGRADRWFRWGVFEFAFTVLLFLLALRSGPVGIAVAWTASFWILVIPAFWYAGRPIQLGIAPVVAAVWKLVFAALLAGGASAVILQTIPALAKPLDALGALIRVVAVSTLFGTLYLGVVILLYGGCAPIYQLMRILREMQPVGKASTPSLTVRDSFDRRAHEAVTPWAS
jgi:O-antigen/teichoic acid export membrane protein